MSDIKLSKETAEALHYDLLSDAAKEIEYQDQIREEDHISSRAILVFTIIGAIGSIIAAVTGIVALILQLT